MKTQLASLDLHYLIKELQFLINSKLDKIYHPSKKELLLQFHVPGIGKKQLKINAQSIYLTEYKSPAAPPSDLCMFLRKKLNNARLRAIKQLGFERILSFDFQTKTENFSLIFELFSRGNIILTKANKILVAAEYQKWAARTIRPGQTYSYPAKEYNLLELKKPYLTTLLTSTNKESLVKCLALDLGLGGIYSEEACLLANIDKNKKPSKLNSKDLEKLFAALKKLQTKKLDPRTVYKAKELIDIVPFELKLYKDLKQEPAKTFSQALDSYFSKQVLLQEKAKFQKQLEKIQEIIQKQKQNIANLKKSELENKEKAELLYQNYKLVSEILQELKKATKKYTWKEIKEKLKGHKLIKEVIPAEKTIIIELK